jgi:hypothetical protein
MLPFYFRPLNYMRYSNMTWTFESIDLHPFICNLVVVVVGRRRSHLTHPPPSKIRPLPLATGSSALVDGRFNCNCVARDQYRSDRSLVWIVRKLMSAAAVLPFDMDFLIFCMRIPWWEAAIIPTFSCCLFALHL